MIQENINNEKKVKIAYANQDVLGMDLRKLKFEKELRMIFWNQGMIS